MNAIEVVTGQLVTAATRVLDAIATVTGAVVLGGAAAMTVLFLIAWAGERLRPPRRRAPEVGDDTLAMIAAARRDEWDDAVASGVTDAIRRILDEGDSRG